MARAAADFDRVGCGVVLLGCPTDLAGDFLIALLLNVGVAFRHWILRESQPVLRESQPVLRESQPVLEETLPRDRESQSVLRESQPVLRKSLPVLRESQPVLKEGTPGLVSGREAAVSAAIADHVGDQAGPLTTSAYASEAPSYDSGEASVPPPSTASPRRELLARLAAELAQLAAAGDVEGAQVLLDTIARLRPTSAGGVEPSAPESAVVPMRARRAR